MTHKEIIKELLPPFLIKQRRKLLEKYGWSGDFQSWEEAASRCSGYENDAILLRVKDAALKVKQGVAVYERDSVLFPKIEYSWPILAALMYVAATKSGALRLIDFGGSLGSSYFQNRRFLQDLREVRWCVVEQDHFVRCGRELFEDEFLRFYNSIDDCVEHERPDAIMLSSVIQYLPNPYDFIKEIVGRSFAYILIDRTGFSSSGRHCITVQQVDPAIYPASYPCHFFSKMIFCDAFKERYDLIAEFKAMGETTYRAEFRGFIYQLRKN